VLAGLQGRAPETCEPDHVHGRWDALTHDIDLSIGEERTIRFGREDMIFRPRERIKGHPNALRFQAVASSGEVLLEETYLSIGGGFIRQLGVAAAPRSRSRGSAAALLARSTEQGLGFAALALQEELRERTAAELSAGIDAIWAAMSDSISQGMSTPGVLPGTLTTPRRAHDLRLRVTTEPERVAALGDPSIWLQIYALAVNEQNAAGGRVVTAPTNGAAGIIPAVLMYCLRFLPLGGRAEHDVVQDFLLTATLIGSLIKANASISGAEGGCQAEVGSACAMAAAGLTAVLGGSPHQVENAAEIALEHHLGLTCDPVAGLVQIPCIERNAIAAATAMTATRLALHGNGTHMVTLDTVIETMRQTGRDMSHKYKETSLAGLAVNVVEC
jgi:L-serine dehydratase